MYLSDVDIEEFEHRGFLAFSGLFDPEEIDSVNEGLPDLYRRSGPEVMRDSEGAVKLVYGAHEVTGPFNLLSRMPRLVQPSRQLLGGEEVYLFQSLLKPKESFTGEIRHWQRDFALWQAEEGMARPAAIAVAVFLEDVVPANGPLLVIPKSHQVKVLPHAEGEDAGSLDRLAVEKLTTENGVEAITGPAGTVVFLHANLVRGSAGNMSPLPRPVMYFNYNAVTNAPSRRGERPWYMSNPSAEAIEPLSDHILRTYNIPTKSA